MSKNMSLITGCAGFIGFHMCQFLLKKNYKVIGIDSLNAYYSKEYKLNRLKILNKYKNFSFYKIDISNKKKITKLFNKFNFTKVIHFAAQPGVIYSFKNPESYKRNNLIATSNLIDLILKKKIKNFIFSSSSSVYGDQKRYPIKENFKFYPINYYAKTKIACENKIKSKLKNQNISTKIIRPFTVYGPYGRPDMLILKLLSAIKNKKKINIYDHGNQLRDFTYIKDVIKIIYLLSKKNNTKIKIYNICASNPISINQIIKIIRKRLNIKIKINYEKKRKGEMKITYGSNSEIKKYLKYTKFTKIESGLNDTIKWFNKFQNKKILVNFK